MTFLSDERIKQLCAAVAYGISQGTHPTEASENMMRDALREQAEAIAVEYRKRSVTKQMEAEEAFRLDCQFAGTAAKARSQTLAELADELSTKLKKD